MKDKRFGDRLKHLRSTTGLSQIEAAKKVGISYASLQNHEGGDIPNQNNIQKYIDFYGCNKNWLITGVGGTGVDTSIQEESTQRQDVKNNIVDFQHDEVIRKFEDKEFAKELNEALVIIEKLSKSTFREIGYYIKGAASALQSAVKESGEQRPAATEAKKVG